MNFKMKSMHPRGSSNMRVPTAHNEKPVRWKKARVQSRERGGTCKRKGPGTGISRCAQRTSSTSRRPKAVVVWDKHGIWSRRAAVEPLLAK